MESITDPPSMLRAAVLSARHHGAGVRAGVRAVRRQGVRASRLLLHAGFTPRRPTPRHATPRAR